MLSLIYARSLNRCIGSGGRLPWQLPDDFAHFLKTTLGKPVIMGRKTYEDHTAYLVGRLNIVVSTQKDYVVADGVELVHSLEDAVALASRAHQEVFIIGGASFYIESFSKADVVYETVIDANIDGDTILPAFDFSTWKTETLQDHPVDERHEFSFKIYKHSKK